MLLAASTLRTTSWPGVPLGADPSGAPIDSNGNLATKTEGSDTWGYEWNARNELTRVTKNSIEQARFAYDPFGRRVEKVAGSVATTYVYDGAEILREVRGSSTLRYVHGPGIDEPLAREDGSGSLTYFHADALGSIIKRTDGVGAVIHEYRYDSWGNIELGAGEPGHAFTAREWDPEIGLHYYRARYYDAGMGRFISQDPIGLSGGLNMYMYARANAVRFTDPSGLKINMERSVLPTPPWQTTTKTCAQGSPPAATCVIRTRVLRVSECKERCGGWGFDATLSVTLQQQFSTSPANPAPESPGRTLQQHEDMHLGDLNDWFSEEEINKAIKTEGFGSKPECESAQRGLGMEYRIYRDMGVAWTGWARDPQR